MEESFKISDSIDRYSIYGELKFSLDICLDFLEENNIYYDIIGKTQNDRMSLENEFDIKLSELDELNTFWFRNYFKYN